MKPTTAISWSWRWNTLRCDVGAIILTILLFARTGNARSQEYSLFAGYKNVKELDPESFSELAASAGSWAINFYSPACVHCQHFARTVRDARYSRSACTFFFFLMPISYSECTGTKLQQQEQEQE